MKSYNPFYLSELLNKKTRFCKMKSHEELDTLYCEYNDYLEGFNKRLLSPTQFINEIMIGCNNSKKDILINFLNLYYENEHEYKLTIDELLFYTLTPHKKYIARFHARKNEKYYCIVEEYLFDNGLSKGFRCYLSAYIIEGKEMNLFIRDHLLTDIKSCSSYLQRFTRYGATIGWFEVPTTDVSGDDK